MRFSKERHTYPAANRIVQAEAAARAGFVGETMIDGDAEFLITKPIERKLEGFARRLRAFGNTKGATNIGADRWEIQVDATSYTVLSKNGKANPALEAE